jgi:Ca-activated chloride channel family protein
MSPTKVATALALLALAAPQQQPTFKSGAKTVAVYATVTERGGRLITDLTREDFELKDSGKVAPITVFSTESQPISVVVMLDRSGSMQGNNVLVAHAAEAFVRQLLPSDKARVGSFGDDIELYPESFTSDQNALINIIRTKLQQRGPTPLWNAIDRAILTLKEQEGRRVVLVFTDGADNPGFGLRNLSFMDIMKRAQQADVMVYAIGLEGRGAPMGGRGGFGGGMTQRPDPGLPAIAEETGGGYFELRSAEDLTSTFERVAQELHQQYLLGFEPAKLDDKMHKIQVRTKRPNTEVRARKEYFAAK